MHHGQHMQEATAPLIGLGIKLGMAPLILDLYLISFSLTARPKNHFPRFRPHRLVRARALVSEAAELLRLLLDHVQVLKPIFKLQEVG